VVGHIAIKMLLYVETMDAEIKRALNESYKKKSKKDNSDEDAQNDDLEQITGGKEAEVEQYTKILEEITENQLIQEGLLGRFLPLISKVAKRALTTFQQPEAVLEQQSLSILNRSAILALCKFMCVSSVICKTHLDLIFDLVSSHVEFGVKANIIITLADLFNRFPNIMNERVKDMFLLLRDREVNVRR